MGSSFIPIRLTMVEICVAALMESAETIEAAHDAAAFLAALSGNHRLWLAIRGIALKNDWSAPSLRNIEFAISRSSGLGRAVTDADVETLVAINRQVAFDLMTDGDIPRIRTRARLAYREGSGGGFIPWLVNEMATKDRLRVLVAPVDRALATETPESARHFR